MKPTSLDELCHHLSTGTATGLRALLPESIQQEAGQFNVFDLADLVPGEKTEPAYPCRAYYKISLLTGCSRAEYPDKTIDINQPTLLFSTPNVPFDWSPQAAQTGQFCVFTAEFLLPTKSGVRLDELPIFSGTEYPVFALREAEYAKVVAIFRQMLDEIGSDYAYKYDLLRTYVLELIHLGQKPQPATALHPAHLASARMTSRFIELLERQFPIGSPRQKLSLRTANQYADFLAVHVNHLNKVLKETTGLTTTDLIAGRVIQEAKILLNQTPWTIAEIADSLGFADVAHFSKFFKRQTSVAPGTFRVLVH